MDRYQKSIRVLFAIIFIAGGLSHFILGRVMPEDYAGFADTATMPWISSLWMSFVMPNIGWLTVTLGVYEIACGLAMIRERTVALASWGMVVFLVFITLVGYGLPSGSPAEDLLKNRTVTAIMVLLLLPLLATRSGYPSQLSSNSEDAQGASGQITPDSHGR